MVLDAHLRVRTATVIVWFHSLHASWGKCHSGELVEYLQPGKARVKPFEEEEGKLIWYLDPPVLYARLKRARVHIISLLEPITRG